MSILSQCTHIAVFPLDKSEEGWHVWPPEVVTGFQASEETSLGQSLEVVLTDILKLDRLKPTWIDFNIIFRKLLKVLIFRALSKYFADQEYESFKLIHHS